MNCKNELKNEDMTNPISKKIKIPFLRVNRQIKLNKFLSRSPSKFKFTKSKNINHQNQEKHTHFVLNNIISKQKHLQMTPNNHHNDSFECFEAVSVSKQLIRKKSQLISLNLKYIELKEKYGTALLNISKGSNTPILFELQDMSNISEKRSQTSAKSIQKLQSLKNRLTKIEFSGLFKRMESQKQLSRSKSSLRLHQ